MTVILVAGTALYAGSTTVAVGLAYRLAYFWLPLAQKGQHPGQVLAHLADAGRLLELAGDLLQAQGEELLGELALAVLQLLRRLFPHL